MLHHEPASRMQNRRLLQDAGYVWNGEAWVHLRTGRTLDGAVADAMTPLQVSRWVDDGE
jgi:hypothetical protein